MVSTNDSSRRRTRPRDWPALLTQTAFVLLLALVVAHNTMSQSLRAAFEVVPGTTANGQAAGPAAAITLDFLCCIPAMLILLRRAIDRTYVLRWSWSQVLLIPLAGWMALSIRRADDQFAAMMGCANFVAGLLLLWSAAQLVRSWLRLRLVAAVCFGLLMILLVNGTIYLRLDLPQNQKMFKENPELLLKPLGIAPDSREAAGMRRKLITAEMLGFNTSANSFAALTVLLMTIGVSTAIQRWIDRDHPAWTICITILILPLFWLLYYTHSKAALVTPTLAAGMLATIGLSRTLLGVNSRRLFWASVASVLLVIAAVVGHGLYHHSLPSASLNFRWRYWVASWRMFWRHPIAGVGWANFGSHYLRDRLPQAGEEIRDPHDFILRFFVELGAVGGVLMLAWIARLWWEMTRPISPIVVAETRRSAAVDQERTSLFHAVPWPLLAGGLGLLLSTLLGVDLASDPNYATTALIERLLFLIAFVIGFFLVAVRSAAEPVFDDRPAPWILYGMLVGIGVFLIHNLIEFSIFEPGIFLLFSLLVGSILGVRQPTMVGRKRAPRGVAIGGAAVVVIGLAVVLVTIVVPIIGAESAAEAGDSALRNQKYSDAADDYHGAWEIMRLNADYIYRAGRALEFEADRSPPEMRTALAWVTLAINGDPSNVGYLLNRAQEYAKLMDSRQSIADFERALSLNPNEVVIHREYADALFSFGMKDQARRQLEKALYYNDQLEPADTKRLPEATVVEIRKQIADSK